MLKIPRWQKQWLKASALLLLLSGCAWLALHLGQCPDELPSPWAPWLMKLHGLAGFSTLLALGALMGHHVPAGWRFSRWHARHRQRASGIVLSTVLSVCVLSAYVLYYFAPETWRDAIGWVHAALGALACTIWFVHRPRRAH